MVEALQPLNFRADRLASIRLFAGLQRADLEFAARCFAETLVERGTRFEAGPQQFRELIRDRSIRRRLATINGSRRPARRRSSAEASAAR